ncbi:hypothetical protein DFS34DRAFT_313491 [Phlyctochytrium arcticum]|nr:hypothetical protein DFS34DRAFT_313491 [Phlyctochytrium arcticum]
MTTIWFQLTTANGESYTTPDKVSLPNANSDVADLREAVKTKCPNDLEKVDANKLLVYASAKALKADIAANKTLTGLKPGKKVDTLGDTDDDHPILIVVPERGQPTTSATWHDLFTQHNDINVDGFYLPRIKLRDQLLSKLQRNQIVVISSPAGSGKTSLSRLFEANIGNVICASLLRSDFAQFIDRLRTGSIIDRHAKTHLLNNNTRCIVWLDDAQATYDQHSHWAELVKDVIPLFGCTNFILSATHLLETRNESPPALRSLPRIKWSDFQITYKEALDLLQAPSPFGLPKNWQTDLLEQVLIRECNGLIAALRVSIDALVDSVAERMTRCFGEKQSTPVDRNLKTFLESCLLQPGRILQVASLDEEAKRHLRWLTKSGILSDTGQDETAVEIKFSSPLAKRFYTRFLFPNRSSSVALPTSLESLMKVAISRLSGSLLRQSTVDDGGFPNETTFQHLLMAAVAASTPPTCQICPELSDVFPENDKESNEKIQGRVNFYLNGLLRWGIELLVSGRGIGEHIDRFSPGGKYYGLRVKDYVVVDFRLGPVSNILRSRNRLSVFFWSLEFKTCHFVYGYDTPLVLELSP